MAVVEAIRSKKNIKKVEKILMKENYRDLLLFCIGINSGLRISDILKLNVGDVKNKNYIYLTEQKTGKNKKFPINEKLKAMFKVYTKGKSENTPLFMSKNRNRLDRIRAYTILNKACYKANIECNIGCHSLRKTFGYHHYKKFKDVAMLQKIFNHSSPNVTLRYIGIEQEEIEKSYMNFIL